MFSVIFEDYGPGIKFLMATIAIIAIMLAICVCDPNGLVYSAFANLMNTFLTRANALAGFQQASSKKMQHYFRGVSNFI